MVLKVLSNFNYIKINKGLAFSLREKVIYSRITLIQLGKGKNFKSAGKFLYKEEFHTNFRAGHVFDINFAFFPVENKNLKSRPKIL